SRARGSGHPRDRPGRGSRPGPLPFDGGQARARAPVRGPPGMTAAAIVVVAIVVAAAAVAAFALWRDPSVLGRAEFARERGPGEEYTRASGGAGDSGPGRSRSMAGRPGRGPLSGGRPA